MKMEHPTFLTKLLLTWIPIGQQPQADGLFFFQFVSASDRPVFTQSALACTFQCPGHQ